MVRKNGQRSGKMTSSCEQKRPQAPKKRVKKNRGQKIGEETSFNLGQETQSLRPHSTRNEMVVEHFKTHSRKTGSEGKGFTDAHYRQPEISLFTFLHGQNSSSPWSAISAILDP